MLTNSESLNELKALETFMAAIENEPGSDGTTSKQHLIETPDLELQLQYNEPLYSPVAYNPDDRRSLDYPTLTLQTWGIDIKPFEVMEWLVTLASSLVSEITHNDVNSWTCGFSAEWSDDNDEAVTPDELCFIFTVTITSVLS